MQYKLEYLCMRRANLTSEPFHPFSVSGTIPIYAPTEGSPYGANCAMYSPSLPKNDQAAPKGCPEPIAYNTLLHQQSGHITKKKELIEQSHNHFNSHRAILLCGVITGGQVWPDITSQQQADTALPHCKHREMGSSGSPLTDHLSINFTLVKRSWNLPQVRYKVKTTISFHSFE